MWSREMKLIVDKKDTTSTGQYTNGLLYGREQQYDRTAGKYTDNYVTREKPVTVFLSDTNLASKFAAIVEGGTYDIKYGQAPPGSRFKPIVDIVALGEPVPQPQTVTLPYTAPSKVQSGHVSPKRTDAGNRDVGMQVGNALNVAANLLASGKNAEDLYKMAVAVLVKSEELKELLTSGNLDTAKLATQDDTNNQYRDIEFDDEIPM